MDTSYTLVSRLHTAPGGRVSTYTFDGPYGRMVAIQLALASFLLQTVNLGAQRAVGVLGSSADGSSADKALTIGYELRDSAGALLGRGMHEWAGLTDGQAAMLRAMLRGHIGPFRDAAKREKTQA